MRPRLTYLRGGPEKLPKYKMAETPGMAQSSCGIEDVFPFTYSMLRIE
jgi:hypothetical protein